MLDAWKCKTFSDLANLRESDNFHVLVVSRLWGGGLVCCYPALKQNSLRSNSYTDAQMFQHFMFKIYIINCKLFSLVFSILVEHAHELYQV